MPYEILRRGDAHFPTTLHVLKRVPEALYVAGSLDGLERTVGIVGTRRATPEALAFTERLASELASQGWLVVSGGAEGIDCAAHEGALTTGRTLAVLPTALDRPYPQAHAALFERIANHGACVTERESGTTTQRSHFLERNRIIAALSRAVVVVQAPFKSGALSTATHARTIERPLLSVPWSPGEPLAEGTNELLTSGARLCRDANDVLRALGEPSVVTTPTPRALAPTDPDESAILAAMDTRATNASLLAERTGLPIPRVMSAVVRLLVAGRIAEDAHGLRRR